MLTQAQLDRGAAYLAGCAMRDGTISGGYSWRDLAAITGEEPGAPLAGLILFDALRAAGRLVDLEPLPGTYGHSRFRIVGEPAADRDAPRDRASWAPFGRLGTRTQPALF
jgi:hypothetical protein